MALAGLTAAALAVGAQAVEAGFDEGLPELHLTLVGPTSPVPKGEEASYGVTVTNQGIAASHPDTRVHLYALKASSHDPAENPFQSVTSSGGACTQGSGGEQFCPIGSLAPGESAQVSATVEVNESMRLFASVGDRDYERAKLTTLVASPPEVSGSKKIKVTGLPSSACPGNFKLKAKAKGAEKMSAALRGPLDEAFKPAGGFSQEKLSTVKGSSLTAKVPVRALDPAYYEVKLLAKFPNRPKQEASVSFQRCE